MSAGKIRIGIIGAGANARLRHIPELQAIDGVSCLKSKITLGSHMI